MASSRGPAKFALLGVLGRIGGKKSLEGQIVVGTLDTIAGQLGPGGFGHAYFDLVITDLNRRA